MAVGDVTSDMQSVANSGYLTIQPGSGAEWIIHNIYYNGGITLFFYDGTNSITVASDNMKGALTGLCLHATNTKYFRVQNTSGSTMYIGFDGIVTK